nr:immunoglobulin light chain junction region [Macaca mulatta]MOX97624.1 immunoglobulin light chain junction region [Macaca mulatta]MOX99772.1 immunoglobulin light chain junction region [Macaca mulatta]
RMQALEFPWTF